MSSESQRAAAPSMCSDAEIAAIAQTLQKHGEPALTRLADALRRWPEDHRLWFLRGSVHASEQRYDEARADFSEAVRLGPTLSIATFMLGFLELVNDHVDEAALTWDALDSLADDDALRVIKNGLMDLCKGRFDVAYEELHRGMVLNTAHPLLNQYVQAVVERIANQGSPDAEPQSGPSNPGGNHLLLTSYLGNNTRH